MAKIEGLAQLLELFRRREALTVSEISTACKISTRTVYRYLKALETLKIPITLDDGYRLIKQDVRGCGEFDRDSLILTASALAQSFLRGYPLLAESLKPVRRLATVQIQRMSAGRLGDLLEVIPPRPKAAKKRENKVLTAFVRAWTNRQKVQISRRGKQKTEPLVPCHIRIADQRIQLVVARDHRSRKRAIGLKEVASLTISREKFRPNK